MKRVPIVGMASLIGLMVSCSSSPKPVARSPIAPSPPLVTKAAPAVTHTSPPTTPTTSNVVISDEIKAACGISEEDAYFAFDSAKIRQEDHGVLNQLATCFSTGPLKGRVMRLIGHADPRGSDEYNMVLGGHRADSVEQYLAQDGLAESQMQTTSRGEMDATGHDEATWAKDRRVDVVLASPSHARLPPLS